MLFAIAVLSVLLVNAGAQQQECILAEWLQELYTKFFYDSNQNLIWNKHMSQHALEEVEEPGKYSKEGSPYLMLKSKRPFSKTDNLRLDQKVRKTIGSYSFLRHAKDLRRLAEGANFGCNGKETEEGDKEYMHIVCFFRN
ncbi:hypothetical protein GCK32_017422 [Trichostrongylus colubriformis]|uniref:SCP domain-containing protein n=1 Tax=Trichostrongylus colubriformis TaxID=6319 RepID=A0AAN8F6E3_TRICO